MKKLQGKAFVDHLLNGWAVVTILEFNYILMEKISDR
jgi:hypothetical protein